MLLCCEVYKRLQIVQITTLNFIIIYIFAANAINMFATACLLKREFTVSFKLCVAPTQLLYVIS